MLGYRAPDASRSIHLGDIITHINGVPITSLQRYSEILEVFRCCRCPPAFKGPRGPRNRVGGTRALVFRGLRGRLPPTPRREEAAWPSGHSTGGPSRRCRVRVPVGAYATGLGRPRRGGVLGDPARRKGLRSGSLGFRRSPACPPAPSRPHHPPLPRRGPVAPPSVHVTRDQGVPSSSPCSGTRDGLLARACSAALRWSGAAPGLTSTCQRAL